VLIDPADLLHPREVADIIGIAAGGVSVYRNRYDDFPEPVIDKGRCVLWLRADVEAWAAGRPPRPSPRPSNQADGQT